MRRRKEPRSNSQCTTSSATKTIIVGDFNIHFEKKRTSSVPEEFSSLIGSFGWIQHAEGPTHTDGHTLDLVISRAADNLVASCEVAGLFSDHLAIDVVVRAHRPVRPRKKISFRSIKKIDMEAFRLDLIDLPLIANPAADVDGLIDQYNVGLASLLEKHAPLRQREITVRPENFWSTEEIETTRRTARMVERRWRNRRLEIDKQLLRYWRDRLVRLCDEAKATKLSALISECGSDQRALFRAVGERLLVKAERKLPEHDSLQELADDFITFFSRKPADLRADLDMRATGGNHLDDLLSPAVADEDCLFNFPPVSRTDVIDIVKLCPTKSCSLDPIPTALLKCVIDILATPIASLYNLSVLTGVFPSKLKLGLITPLLKKPSLCPNQKANFRPVTNVSFSSKCLERLALRSLVHHLSVNNLFVPVQSAYRGQHSTETALLRVYNDLLLAVDDGDAAVLVLLDFSAAFDTVDHGILLRRLESRFGIRGKALEWMESYVTGRHQAVLIDGYVSSHVPLRYGVAQGSVLGPIVFTLYTSPLHDLICAFGINCHFFSDDTQLYKVFRFLRRLELHGGSQKETCRLLASCIAAIQAWTVENKLSLNVAKTDSLTVSAEKAALPASTIDLREEVIISSTSVRNLGAIFDTNLRMDKHVSDICRRGFYHIRRIALIRKYLDHDATARLISAFVLSLLDNGNSLLVGLTEKQLDRLQSVQNAAVRLINRSSRTERIKPQLKALHWLPVRSRIDFKIATLAYRCVHRLAPSYLSELVSLQVPKRSGLRSETDMLKLVVPTARKERWGERSFSCCAPRIWNALPLSLRSLPTLSSFRAQLKTFMFRIVFP